MKREGVRPDARADAAAAAGLLAAGRLDAAAAAVLRRDPPNARLANGCASAPFGQTSCCPPSPVEPARCDPCAGRSDQTVERGRCAAKESSPPPAPFRHRFAASGAISASAMGAGPGLGGLAAAAPLPRCPLARIDRSDRHPPPAPSLHASHRRHGRGRFCRCCTGVARRNGWFRLPLV